MRAITQHTHLSKHNCKCKCNITFKQQYTCNNTAHTRIQTQANINIQYYIRTTIRMQSYNTHNYQTTITDAHTIWHSNINTHAITQHAQLSNHNRTCKYNITFKQQHTCNHTAHTHNYSNTNTNANTIMHSDNSTHAITPHTHISKHNHECKYNIAFKQPYTCNNTTHSIVKTQSQLQIQY